jgi:hypothetical protein
VELQEKKSGPWQDGISLFLLAFLEGVVGKIVVCWWCFDGELLR